MPLWKILVVDDDPDIRHIASLALGRLGGFEVKVAANAEEALASAAARPPDLVLLDVTMPGTDGPATLRAMRALPAMVRVPVVFFTATSNDADIARLCALGAVGVIAKPFDIVDLPRRVRAMIEKARAEL